MKLLPQNPAADYDYNKALIWSSPWPLPVVKRIIGNQIYKQHITKLAIDRTGDLKGKELRLDVIFCEKIADDKKLGIRSSFSPLIRHKDCTVWCKCPLLLEREKTLTKDTKISTEKKVIKHEKIWK